MKARCIPTYILYIFVLIAAGACYKTDSPNGAIISFEPNIVTASPAESSPAAAIDASGGIEFSPPASGDIPAAPLPAVEASENPVLAAPETPEPAPLPAAEATEIAAASEPPELTESPDVAASAEAFEPPEPDSTLLDRIIFLGDSTTYGLRHYGLLSGGRNTRQVWTPASGTLTLDRQSFATIVYPPSGEEIPIREAAELEKPEILLITLGVNGVSYLSEERFKAEYGDLIDGILEVSPETKIVLQSMFPVSASYEHLASINNDKISAANVWIRELAEDRGADYIDSYVILADEADGFLPESYHNGDGLHLNAEAYGLVLNNIAAQLTIAREDS
ncbi:MAG: GDSL-type esterase/lipase family protein [Oscillospiraceae bacterium]|jgi:hypothetical protein|nr:GDSL-type esterase/lipase family protein [Oscillospiraceae bacterium]